MEEIEKALQEVEESKKSILQDKEKIQAEIDRCAGAIRKFLESDRDRKQHMNEFQNKRKIILDGMNSMLSNQEDLKKIVEEVRQPVSKVLSYYNRSYASVTPASSYKSFEISDKSFEKHSYSTSYYSSEPAIPNYRCRSLIFSVISSQTRSVKLVKSRTARPILFVTEATNDLLIHPAEGLSAVWVKSSKVHLELWEALILLSPESQREIGCAVSSCKFESKCALYANRVSLTSSLALTAGEVFDQVEELQGSRSQRYAGLQPRPARAILTS
eukprot:763843-Hanusia_phi.AAC.2